MKKKIFPFLRQRMIWRSFLILAAICPSLVFSPDVLAGAKLRGNIVVRTIKKSDRFHAGKRLDHPVKVDSREMIEMLQNLYFSRKLPVL